MITNSGPFQSEAMNRRLQSSNVYRVVRELASGQSDLSVTNVTAERADEMFSNLGTQYAGEFIAPSADATSYEPTDTGFTGSAMGGNGWTFDAVDYNFVAVAAGVLQAGFNTEGKFIAGAGAVTIDENGVGITEGTAGGKPGQDAPHGVTFYDSSGNAVGQLLEYLNGSTGYRYSQLDVVVPSDVTHKAINEIRVLDSSGNALTYITVTGDGTIEIGTDANGSTLTIDAATGTISHARTSGFFGIGTPTELTIASGAVTATQSHHTIDTQGDAASDDLDTINGGTEGDLIWLSAADAARDVVVKDATGNIFLNGDADFTMDSLQDVICLKRGAANWFEQYRSNPG